MTADTLSNYVRSDFADRSREAELLLTEISREGRTSLLTSERAFLAREMGWDDAEIKRQLRRVNNILRLQAIAGRPEDREAALQECQVSTDLLAKESPKIREKIQELQAKLSGLERDATSAQRRVEQQAEAVQQLRSQCPVDIRERVQQAVNVVEAGIGKDLRDAKARLNELRSILNLDNCHETPQRHLEFCLSRMLPAAVTTATVNRMIQRRYSPEWPAIKAQHECEYTERSELLPGIQAEYDSQIQQAELPLDFYADPANQAEG